MPSPVGNHESELILETARTRLRKMALTDAGFMLELLNEPAFIENVADRHVRTLAEAETFITERMLPSYEKFGFGFYILELKEEQIPIGICGLIKRDTLADVDIGYALLTRHNGKGYAYEATAALFAHGKEQLQIPRIIAVTSPKNARSIKLLEKLGLQFEKMVSLPGFASETMLYS